MFDRIKNTVKNLFGGNSIYSMFTALTSQTFRPHNWLQWFKISPKLRAVDKIANDIAGIGLKEIDSDGNEVEGSDAMNLLDMPNQYPEYDSYTLMWISTVYYLVLGEIFWWMPREGTMPERIFPIPPTWIKSIPRQEGDMYHMQTADGVVVYIPYDQMIYQKRPDITKPYKRGVGLSQMIGDELQVDEYMSKHQQLLFKNGAMPTTVASLDNSNKGQRDRFKSDWYKDYGGLRNSGKIAVVDGKAVSFQVLQQSIKDLDFINSRKFVNDMVLQHFSISKELLGNTENANRASILEAQKIYDTNVKKVLVEMYERTFKRQYMPMFGSENEIVFEDYMEEDKEFIYKDADAGWENGLYTRNEARLMKGMDTVDDGDVYKGQLSTVFIPAQRSKTIAVDETKTIEPELVIEVITPQEEFRAKFFKALDDSAENAEEGAIALLRAYFAAQGEDINQILGQAASGTFISQSAFEGLLDTYYQNQDEELLEIILQIWSTSAELGSDIANTAYSLGVSFDVVNPAFIAQAQAWGGERVSQINGTTKKQIKDAIVQGIGEGESIEQIADRIDHVFDIADRSRSVTIARTETHTATVAGTQFTYQAAGIQQTEWMTSLDGREREWHGSMDGQIRGISEPFESGLGNLLNFPGDPSAPAEEIVNCRCVLLPVFD